jgi:hypothetical protein
VRHLALSLLVLAATAAPAAASERTLSEQRGQQVLAHGEFVSWAGFETTQERSLWRGGDVFADVRLPFNTTLGSDRSRRSVALATRCSDGYSEGCVVTETRLPRGPSRVLYRGRDGEDTPIGASYRGTFALLAGGRSGQRPRGLYVRRAGSTRLRRIAKNIGMAWNVSLGARWVAYRTVGGEEEQVRVVDLEGGGSRALALNDTLDDDCRCTPTAARVDGPVVAGRYAYWLETTYPQHMVGDPSITRMRIGRARLDAERRPEIEYFSPERRVTSFALRGSRIVYTSGYHTDPPGIHEVTDPAWTPSGQRIPART